MSYLLQEKLNLSTILGGFIFLSSLHHEARSVHVSCTRSVALHNLPFPIADEYDSRRVCSLTRLGEPCFQFHAPVGAQAADEMARARGGSAQPAACRDTTPHHVTFVEVEPGVRLEVLDWGGADKPQTMVLLTGLGDNAHVYDPLAFQFTDDFHVIGITRRGFLPSSQPEHGYDVVRRTSSIR